MTHHNPELVVVEYDSARWGKRSYTPENEPGPCEWHPLSDCFPLFRDQWFSGSMGSSAWQNRSWVMHQHVPGRAAAPDSALGLVDFNAAAKEPGRTRKPRPRIDQGCVGWRTLPLFVLFWTRKTPRCLCVFFICVPCVFHMGACWWSKPW